MLKFRVWEFTTAKGHFCDNKTWRVMRTMDEKSTKWKKALLEAHQDTLWSIFTLRYNVMCYFFTLIAELRGWDTWTLPPTYNYCFECPQKPYLNQEIKKPAKFFYTPKIPEWRIEPFINLSINPNTSLRASSPGVTGDIGVGERRGKGDVTACSPSFSPCRWSAPDELVSRLPQHLESRVPPPHPPNSLNPETGSLKPK